jgi:endonuclease/exonuclease/phosphatase family metal-dependent hydrolase
LRLASFNIHSGVGQDNRLDLHRTAELLNGFDLIWLNEVRGGQTEELSRLLARQGIFEPSERRFWHESFGSALLFDPATVTGFNWRRTQLASGANMAFRNMVQLEMPFGTRALHVLLAHVGRDSDHKSQLQTVTETFLQLPTPAVLMGDMNTTADDPVMRGVLDRLDVEDPVGRKTGKPLSQRLDYILFRDLAWTNAGLVENNASDHPVAWVEITSLPPASK